MSTINIVGTGGIIEGDLGAANVNVNLDSTLYFDGNVNDDRIVVSDDNTAATGDFGTGNFSVSLWIYVGENGFDTSDTWGSIISKGFTTSAPANTWSILRTASNNNISFQGASNAGGAFPINMSIPSGVVLGAWNHVAFTRNGTSVKLYHQGQLVNSATASETGDFSNSADFKIGTNHSNAQSANGSIADVKLFSDELTAAEVQYLSSKVQADPDIGGLDNCESWWKINEGTGTNVVNHKKGAANGTITGAEWQYDKFSVDVYDNSTTTDGTFTVTQGKVEGKALTSLAFDGTNDNVILASDITLANDFSIATWIRADEFSSNVLIGNSNGNHKIQFVDSTTLQFNINGQGNENTSVSGLSTDTWHHFVVTRVDSTGETNIYVDGVLVGSKTFDANNDFVINRLGIKDDSPYDGDIRDLRIYEYELSAEQAASLYSNTYPQTPEHNWKLDDSIQGVTTDTAVDSGTATAVNGTLDGIGGSGKRAEAGASSGWQNGTLDLDGTLTIAANGTLSAPRGNLDIEATDFDTTGTFTHNNGKVRFVGSGNHITIKPNGRAFYNVDVDKDSGHDVKLREDMIIENVLDLTGASDYFIIDANGAGGDVTLTMGTLSASGTIESSDVRRFRLNTHSSGKCIIQGASTLFPCNVTGQDWKWDYGSGAAGTELANMNFQVAVNTHSDGSNAAKITLTGDCEFDAVTVSSGDTLDLNGQRAVVSGVLSGSGAMNANNSTLIFTGTSGTVFDGGEGPDLSVTDSTDCTFICDAGSGSQVWKNRFQSSDATIFVQSGTLSLSYWNWEDITNFFVGDTFDNSSANRNVTTDNLTIPTGGTLSAGSGTLTCAGDFTTSGGLVNLSAFKGVANDRDLIEVPDHADLDFTNTFTAEIWFKAARNDVHQYLFDRRGGSSGAAKSWFLYLDTTTDNLGARIRATSTAAGTTFYGNTTGLADGKWHHAALVYDKDATDGRTKIYIDGKLDVIDDSAEGPLSADDSNFYIGGRYSYEYTWDGNLAEPRLWSVARTPAQIRADMFNSDTLANNTGLVGQWKMTEGTGSTFASTNTNLNGTAVSYSTGSEVAITDAWATAGTFTYGTSTLKMTGTSKKINYNADLSMRNLTIATGGDSNSITLNDIVGNNSGIIVFGTLEQESGKLVSTSNEYVQIGQNFGEVKVASGKGAIAFADIAKFFIYQNSGSGSKNFPASDSADKDLTIQRLFITSSSTIEAKATGNLTITAELEVGAGNTFNANTNTIAVKEVDVNGSGTLDLRNSTLDFSVTTSGDTLSIEATGTLTTGNTTITGHTAQQTPAVLPDDGDFEVVGNVSDLKIMSGGDLTVIGSVTNCLLQDSTANIRQFFHTLDTQQLLDADEAGDDDLRLTKPALDNALELMTR
jgi:hypothetical protein